MCMHVWYTYTLTILRQQRQKTSKNVIVHHKRYNMLLFMAKNKYTLMVIYLQMCVCARACVQANDTGCLRRREPAAEGHG